MLTALILALTFNDAAVARAVALLESLGIRDLPAIEVVSKSPVSHTVAETVAYVVSGDPTIYVIASSRAYRRAVKGDARQLAGVLAHERYHVRYGVHEGPAYAEQLRVLKALKVDADTSRNVQQAAALHAHDWPRVPKQ